MTLPDERYRAVRSTEQFLMDLCMPAKTPRVPRAVRQRAFALLRHYPGTWDMDRVSHKCPEVFESPNKLDPIQVWVLDGMEAKK
jgi:hypothetical protein